MDNISGVEVVPLWWCVDAMHHPFERPWEAGWNDPIDAYSSIADTPFRIVVVDEKLNCKYYVRY